MKTELKTKRIIYVSGDVQLPIKVGEELRYISGNIMYWTDRVKKILEIADEYVRVETGSYYYTIERQGTNPGEVRLTA
ncbi:MAG TPA: hypothetical protein H9740_01860 [Candidatus Hungatella pullicola]|nr:hypothetical protein [Candidatus Hungatella pullicola]